MLFGIVALVVLVAAVSLSKSGKLSAGAAISGGPPWVAPDARVLDEAGLAELVDIVARELGTSLSGHPPVESAFLSTATGPVYVALRVNGKHAGSAWADRATTRQSVVEAVRAARDSVRPARLNSLTSAEICIGHTWWSVAPGRHGKFAVPNHHRGVLGIEFRAGEHVERVSPTQMLANNWSFANALDRVSGGRPIDNDNIARGHASIRLFDCSQAFVTLSGTVQAHQMERGNITVALEEVTRPRVRETANLMGDWLARAVQDNGRMVYKYWPSRQEESVSNNMIRQWMATVALGRFARANPDKPGLVDLVERNIQYNLSAFYREESGLGLIDYDGSVKLGAVALAALAIAEHPRRADFAGEESGLRRTVDHLWNEDGSFRTFYFPPDRNDNQNFYPGEALLLWSALYAEHRDPDLLQRFLASFRYYRAWHLDERNRNPAFVPWHTQACYAVWRETGDSELRRFIFMMNDWLLAIQQWESAEYPDLRGRFYDPKRPHYGPPHASSTGVYLEGLIDAFQLAREMDDAERMAGYRLAIRRGLRSVIQLQFRGDVDCFYVQERDRVLGGIRTEVYNNEIRVDNVQHNLMAILKILNAFSPEDFSGYP